MDATGSAFDARLVLDLVLAVKFGEVGSADSLVSSPKLAALAHAVADQVEAAASDPERSLFSEWRTLEGDRREFAVAIGRLQCSPIFFRATRAERRQLLMTELSPFVPTEEAEAWCLELLDQHWAKVVHGPE